MSQFQRNGIPLLIASTIQLAFIIHYVVYEKTRHGLRALCANRFVVISLLGNLFVLFNSINNVIVFLILDQQIAFSPVLLGTIDVLGIVSFWMALAAHLALALLRSDVIFRSSSLFLRIMRISMLLFFALAIGTSTLFILGFFSAVISQFTAQLVDFVALLTFSIIDLICTFAFARYVQQIDSTLDCGSSFISNEIHRLQTKVIVKRSAMICFLTSISSISYGAIVFVRADALTTEAILVIEQIVLVICMVMWMRLKIELDGLNGQHKQSTTKLMRTGSKTNDIK
jgi:hypothetical protein